MKGRKMLLAENDKYDMPAKKSYVKMKEKKKDLCTYV